jgi:hypothetical protein
MRSLLWALANDGNDPDAVFSKAERSSGTIRKDIPKDNSYAEYDSGTHVAE